MNKPFHIFVCHYTKLLDRKTHIDTQLAKLDNIKVHFINEYDAEMINEDVDKKYFLYDNLEWNKRWGYYIHGHGENCGRTLKISEKSLALKHYISLTKILDYNLDYALIIEDDAVFCDDFLYKLDNILNNIPEDWDLYFPNSIKNMFGIKSMDINNKYLVKQPPPSTAYSISYLINKKCCQEIINEIENNKIVLPIDFEYNWIFYKLDLNVYFNKKTPLISCANLPSCIGH